MRTLKVRKVNTIELTRDNMISFVVEPNVGMHVIPYSKTRGQDMVVCISLHHRHVPSGVANTGRQRRRWQRLPDALALKVRGFLVALGQLEFK